MIKYLRMPSSNQWKKHDSYVRDIRVVRTRDKVLGAIDAIVEAFEKSNSNGMHNYLMIELYFATNYWLRNFQPVHTNLPPGRAQLVRTEMHPGREDAVRALCRYSIEQMAKGFHCGIQAVPTQLERFYGRTMSTHGRETDKDNSAHYMKRAEIEQYKLIFDGGRAWCFDWENKKWGDEFVLEHAHTADIKAKDSEPNTLGDIYSNWARFAMSMSGDIYVAPHASHLWAAGLRQRGNVAAPVVHSSYLAGLPVLCAGSIWIIDGEVVAIKSDSGHYQPAYQQLMNVARHLGVVGVNLENVDVYDYEGWPLGSAKEFMANNQHWRRRIDQTGDTYKQTKDVEGLVQDRINYFKRVVKFDLYLSKSKKTVPDETLRKFAFRSVCDDLAIALNDPSWRQFAEKNKVMPQRQAPQPPKRPPPRPATPHPGRFKTPV